MPDAQPSAPVSVGDVVDNRYELHSLVSNRGHETMFRGRQVSLNRDVSVKVLRDDANADDSRRFFNEARAVAQLEHPNCMQVLEYGETNAGVKFIAINFTGGHPLSMDLGTPIPEERATLYMKDILQGLEHAHSRGVSHRELTPDAIMVAGDLDGHERAVITEFGGAATTTVSPALTLGEMLSGNPRYSSPEQNAGLAGDESSDLYSAGIIFFEMLTGRAPFEDEDPVMMMNMHLEQPLPDLGPNVSQGLADIVRKLTAKQRHDRYASASEALMALETHIGGFSTASSSAMRAAIVASASGIAPQVAPHLAPPSPAVTGPNMVVNPDAAHASVEPPSNGRRLWLGVAAAALGAITIGILAAAPGDDSASGAAAAGTDAPAVAGIVADGSGNSDTAALALLAQVNDSNDPLEYGPRQQALAVLADTSYAKNVDDRLQTKLDLLQASTAPEPCPTFSSALEKANEDEGEYFTPVLASVKAPAQCEQAAVALEASRPTKAEAEAAPVDQTVVAVAEQPAVDKPSVKRKEKRQRSSRRPAPQPKKQEPMVQKTAPPAAPAPRKPAKKASGITKLGTDLKGL